MSLQVKKLTALSLTLILFTQSSFAKLADATSESHEVRIGKPLAVVRVEDEIVSCVQFVDPSHITDGSGIPLCPTEGPVADEVNLALKVAASGAAKETAMLGYVVAVGAMGCAIGAFDMWLMHDVIMEEAKTYNRHAGHTTGVSHSLIANLMFIRERTWGQHGIAVAGSLICGHVTYLLIHKDKAR